MKQLLINNEGLETRVAVVADGKLQDFFIERKDEDRLVGSIYKGVVRNLEPSLQAAFVDIGADKNAFLHYWDMLPATDDMLEGGGDDDSGESGPEESDDTEFEAGDEGNDMAPPVGSVLMSLKEKIFARYKRSRATAKPGGPTATDSPPSGQARNKGRGRGRGGSRGRGGKGGGKGRGPTQPELTVEDIPNLFPVNSEVLVQVTKGPIGTKGARVTTNLSIPGRYLVLLPNSSHVGVSKRIESGKERDRLRQIIRRLNIPQGMGLICRTLGAEKKEVVFQQDFEMLIDAWKNAEGHIKSSRPPCCVYQEPQLAERILRDYLTEDIDEIISDSNEIHETAVELARRFRKEKRVKTRLYRGAEPIFDKYNLTRQIDNIFGRRVALPSGGHICIDETEALIAIDVNTGKNRAGKDHPETILNTNLEAVNEIARQLRLRNLGGLLVLDLIDMRSREDRQTVYRALRDALENDRAKTKICPISTLGLIEMTRQREYESLLDTMFDPCPYCEGKGRVKSPTSISVEIQRKLHTVMRRTKDRHVRVNVHPHVLERLKNEDAPLLREMEKDLGGELSFRADPEMHREQFEIIDHTTGRKM